MPNLPHLRDDRESFPRCLFRRIYTKHRRGKPRSRRLVIFCCVCLPVLVLGLAYTVMRPAEYQATARLEITPASATPASVARRHGGATTGAETREPTERGSKSFLTEVQVLTSRPLLEEVVGRLTKSGDLPPDIGSDPVDERAAHAQHRDRRGHRGGAAARRGSAAAVPGAIGEYFDQRLPGAFGDCLPEVDRDRRRPAARLGSGLGPKKWRQNARR